MNTLLVLALSLLLSSDPAAPTAVTADAPSAPPGPRERAFVAIDLKGGAMRQVHPEQAAKRLSPCSTFKIPHALIALQTGAVATEFVVEAWDGTPQRIKTWEKDQTLATAIRDSCVWFFQRTARRIGPRDMKTWLRDIDYGNRDISGGIDTFWLDSTLEISPREQAAFLARLWKETLPFEPEHVETVKRLLLWSPQQIAEVDPEWPAEAVLSAKTGNGSVEGPGGTEQRVSWLVGHVLAGGKEHVFASVVTGPGPMDRFEGARAAVDGLRDLGILPPRATSAR